jgi:hypothetical protein
MHSKRRHDSGHVKHSPPAKPATPDIPDRMENHATDERRHAAAEMKTQLEGRGVRITGGERDEELATLMEAVESFENAVVSAGGDLMMDAALDGNAPTEPDDRRFVLPTRGMTENIESYTTHVTDATDRVRRGKHRADSSHR